MTIEITSKIVGVRIKKEQANDAVIPAAVAVDENPLTLRIESRPQGALQAISEKIIYVGTEGKKKVYVLVSFMPVTGMVNGKEITIERPVEFFIPSGQLSSEHQWITASMRSLSLAARGGYVTQALQDLRKVTWDRGVVRCGINKWGKPQFHDSEVAAIAWSIQQILMHRGFLDDEGNQVPVERLADQKNTRQSVVSVSVDEKVAVEEVAVTDTGHKVNSVGECPTCSGSLVLMDGCPTCVEGCGYSKCG
ncbi:ribonucleotide-diphosphate reductase subunit alpha [compost metagenome]